MVSSVLLQSARVLNSATTGSGPWHSLHSLNNAAFPGPSGNLRSVVSVVCADRMVASSTALPIANVTRGKHTIGAIITRVRKQTFRACEKIAVVQAFRPAVSGGPECPHYVRALHFAATRPLAQLLDPHVADRDLGRRFDLDAEQP